VKVTVTARHCEVEDALRERAGELANRVARFAHRPQRAEIVFDNDHQQHVVEIRLYVPRGGVHISSAEAADFRTALDRAADKLRNQLDKAHPAANRRAAVGEK
jgi:ribosomal subunit interface protein